MLSMTSRGLHASVTMASKSSYTSASLTRAAGSAVSAHVALWAYTPSNWPASPLPSKVTNIVGVPAVARVSETTAVLPLCTSRRQA